LNTNSRIAFFSAGVGCPLRVPGRFLRIGVADRLMGLRFMSQASFLKIEIIATGVHGNNFLTFRQSVKELHFHLVRRHGVPIVSGDTLTPHTIFPVH
jgi:hypothetical protein